MNNSLIRSAGGAGLGAFFGIIFASTLNTIWMVPVGAVFGWLIGSHREAIIPGARTGLRLSGTIFSTLFSVLCAVPLVIANGAAFGARSLRKSVIEFRQRIISEVREFLKSLFTVSETHVESVTVVVAVTQTIIGMALVILIGLNLENLGIIPSNLPPDDISGWHALLCACLVAFVLSGLAYGISSMYDGENRKQRNRSLRMRLDRIERIGFLGFCLYETLRYWRGAITLTIAIIVFFSFMIATVTTMFFGLAIFAIFIGLPVAACIGGIFFTVWANQYRNFGSLIIGLVVGMLTFLFFRAELVADPIFRLSVATIAGFVAGGVSLTLTYVADFLRKIPPVASAMGQRIKSGVTAFFKPIGVALLPAAVAVGKAIKWFEPFSDYSKPETA